MQTPTIIYTEGRVTTVGDLKITQQVGSSAYYVASVQEVRSEEIQSTQIM